METIIINKRALTALLVVLLFTNTFAQSNKSEKVLKRAKKYFEVGYFEKAQKIYLEVLKEDSSNVEANYYNGVAIIEDSNHKWEALKYLLRAYRQDSLFDNKMDYYLGLAYQYNNSFEDAIPNYEIARKKVSLKEKHIRNDIDERIEQCKVGMELADSKDQIEIENLGPKVNSPSDDYAPVYSPADEKIIFTSDRKGSKRSLLDMLSKQSYDDIYEVKINDETDFNEANNLGNNLNTKYHDSGLSIDRSGNTMLVYHSKNNGDIYMSEFINGGWSEPINLGDNVNTPEYLESSATLSPDGRALYFTSSRPGGYGGTDIYFCERVDDKWGAVKNMGEIINTEGEEEAPYISSDGNTLYFSSTGHKGIGGFDIFYAERDPISGEWSTPKNLGIPVNTPQDDIYFVLSKDGRSGYYSAIHRDSYGGRDIYRVSMVDDDHKNATLLANSNINPRIQSEQQENLLSRKISFQSNVSYDENEGENDSSPSSIPRNTDFDLKAIMRNIYFDTDNNNIRGKYYEKLDQVVAYLKENKSIGIEISGHSDIIGDKAYNLALSIKRAEAVRQYLVNNGIEATRLVVKGYGSKIPLASNDDEQNGRALNRRVELDLIENDLVITSLAN